ASPRSSPRRSPDTSATRASTSESSSADSGQSTALRSRGASAGRRRQISPSTTPERRYGGTVTYDHQGRTGRRLTATVTDLDVAVQKAFLVGVQLPDHDTLESERSLDELALLTDTAGSEPVGMELVRRDAPDAAWYIGSGKAEELAQLTTALDVDVVVFDNP